MQTLASLLVTVAAACAIARPSAAPAPTPIRQEKGPLLVRMNVEPLLTQAEVGPLLARDVDPLLAREVDPILVRAEEGPLLAPVPVHMLLRRYSGYYEIARPPYPIPENDWLSKEINRLSQMKDEDSSLNTYNEDLARWLAQNPHIPLILRNQILQESIEYDDTEQINNNLQDVNHLTIAPTRPALPKRYKTGQEVKDTIVQSRPPASDNNRKKFALTPFDNEYYEVNNQPKESRYHKDGEPRATLVLEPQRQTRQNPNLSKQKNLLGPQLENFNTALSHKTEAASEVVDWPHHTHMLEAAPAQPTDTIYGVTILAIVGAALAAAVVGFAFGWRTLSKKAKAAAEVDYPAYGVTGPTIDTSGDRKLAHSAHMYHYQHQKQQIIAMVRNGLEQRAGSISDPESEEENEEGDYTVYECPGFATTGEMEVQNPLFTEDPMTATPGKCEMGKTQSKE